MEKINDLNSNSYDYKFLTEPFGISKGRESQHIDNSRMSASRRSASGVSNASVIFTKAVGKSGGSATDLKFVFIFCLIGLTVELIVMYQKHHFFSLLAFLSVFAMFFLNYFDKYYMGFVLGNLTVAVVLDLVWIFVRTGVFFS